MSARESGRIGTATAREGPGKRKPLPSGRGTDPYTQLQSDLISRCRWLRRFQFDFEGEFELLPVNNNVG